MYLAALGPAAEGRRTGVTSVGFGLSLALWGRRMSWGRRKKAGARRVENHARAESHRDLLYNFGCLHEAGCQEQALLQFRGKDLGLQSKPYEPNLLRPSKANQSP